MSKQPVDRLKQYVLLLGSSHPGEVAAAAGMLIKHLKSQGKDIHDLAALVTGATPVNNTKANDATLTGLRNALKMEQQFRLNAEARNKQLQGQIDKLKKDVQTLQIQLLTAQANTQQSTGQTSANMPGDDYVEPPEGEWVFKPLHRTWWQKACWCLNYADRSTENLLTTADYNFLVKMSNLKPSERIGYMGERQIDDIYTRLQRVKAASV
jgi:hypothetical protein